MQIIQNIVTPSTFNKIVYLFSIFVAPAFLEQRGIKHIIMAFFTKHRHRIVLVVTLMLLLLYGCFSERIEVHEGLGYDGYYYSLFTTNFAEHIRDHTINSYYFQRMGLPFLIHHLFSAFHIGFSAINIIRAYSVANMVCILLSVIFFFLTSSRLKLDKSIEITGFASLFFCFPVLKLSPYYPVLMDIPAYTIAIMMVYFYVKDNILAFFLLLLMGSFVFPTFIIFSMLFLFKKQEVLADPGSWEQKWKLFHRLFCWSTPIISVYMFVKLYYLGSKALVIEEFTLRPVKTTIIWCSFLVTLVYLVYFNYFSKHVLSLKKILKSINPFGVVLTLTVMGLIWFMVNKYASSETAPLTLKLYLSNIVYQYISNPLNYSVAHVFYYGPLFLISFMIVKKVKSEVVRFGFGTILLFAVFIFFSMGNESRQLINYVPFFTLLMLIILNRYFVIPLYISVIYSIICLALSHFWYKINIAQHVLTDYFEYGEAFKYPKQRYFQFQGPWVSDANYLIHLVVCVAIGMLIFMAFKKGRITEKTV